MRGKPWDGMGAGGGFLQWGETNARWGATGATSPDGLAGRKEVPAPLGRPLLRTRRWRSRLVRRSGLAERKRRWIPTHALTSASGPARPIRRGERMHSRLRRVGRCASDRGPHWNPSTSWTPSSSARTSKRSDIPLSPRWNEKTLRCSRRVFSFRRGERIRTSDPLTPSQVR